MADGVIGGLVEVVANGMVGRFIVAVANGMVGWFVKAMADGMVGHILEAVPDVMLGPLLRAGLNLVFAAGVSGAVRGNVGCGLVWRRRGAGGGILGMQGRVGHEQSGGSQQQDRETRGRTVKDGELVIHGKENLCW